MRAIGFLMLFFLASAVFAQQDTTLIYARSGYEKDPLRSMLKKNVMRKDSSWVLTLTDKKGAVQELVSFADEKLEVRQGSYVLYQNGNVVQQGTYNRGYKVGEWLSYHPNKKLDETINFIWGKRQGQFRRYWDNGQLKEEGKYIQDQKVDEWKLFLQDGKVAALTTYNSDGEEVAAEYFDQPGIKIKKSVSYLGGLRAFYGYLDKEIRYPKASLDKNEQGTVRLSFIVKRDGSLTGFKVKESPSPELSKEAIRVVGKSTGWIPGQLLGETVDMRINIPVKFVL